MSGDFKKVIVRNLPDLTSKSEWLWIGESHTLAEKFSGRLIAINKSRGEIQICKTGKDHNPIGRVMKINFNEGSVFVGTIEPCEKCGNKKD